MVLLPLNSFTRVARLPSGRVTGSVPTSSARATRKFSSLQNARSSRFLSHPPSISFRFASYVYPSVPSPATSHASSHPGGSGGAPSVASSQFKSPAKIAFLCPEDDDDDPGPRILSLSSARRETTPSSALSASSHCATRSAELVCVLLMKLSRCEDMTASSSPPPQSIPATPSAYRPMREFGNARRTSLVSPSGLSK